MKRQTRPGLSLFLQKCVFFKDFVCIQAINLI